MKKMSQSISYIFFSFQALSANDNLCFHGNYSHINQVKLQSTTSILVTGIHTLILIEGLGISPNIIKYERNCRKSCLTFLLFPSSHLPHFFSPYSHIKGHISQMHMS